MLAEEKDKLAQANQDIQDIIDQIQDSTSAAN